MWKNTVQPDRLQMKIWFMRISCWIPKATNTHSKNVILIAFLRNSGCTNAPQYYVIRTVDCLSCPTWICGSHSTPWAVLSPSWRFSALVRLRLVFVGNILVVSPPGWERKWPEFSCCAASLERSSLLLGWQYSCLLPNPNLSQCNSSDLHKYRGIYQAAGNCPGGVEW
jgi:hypothetical protein